MSARESLFSTLRDGAFPFNGLTDYEVRVALAEACGLLDDNDLGNDFAQRAEEAIAGARGQAMEP